MIYLDYAATSPLHPEILKSYQTLLQESFANSESIYDLGFKVKNQLERSREICAQFLGVQAKDLIFTSGASEANALAIKGVAFGYEHLGKHLITTAIEHSSVLEAFKQLENLHGFELTILEVDEYGLISLKQLKESLRDDTILVSIMAVNNEIGTIQPIQEAQEIIDKHSHAFFHVDSVQALGKINLDIRPFDLASFSAHKIGGLKGSGLLYKKQHIRLAPLIHGGTQEYAMRGGTVNSHAQILFAKTMRLALDAYEKNQDRIKTLKEFFVREISLIDNCSVNSPAQSSDFITSFSTNHVPSEIMLNGLVAKGIYVSARSTCHGYEKTRSYVLEAIGAKPLAMDTVIRVSFGYDTTKEDVSSLLQAIKEIINYVGPTS